MECWNWFFFQLPASTTIEMGNKESVEFTTTGPGPGSVGSASNESGKPAMRTSLSMEPALGIYILLTFSFLDSVPPLILKINK